MESLVYGSVFIPIALFIFSVCLLIAPLVIWKWTKRTCREVAECRKLLARIDVNLGEAAGQKGVGDPVAGEKA